MRRVLIALVLLASAPAAHAGSVGLLVADEDIGDGATARKADILFTGAEGERNELTITRAGTILTYADAAAPITLVGEAIQACRLVDANTARCTVPDGADNGFFSTVDADLGDRNDTLTVNNTEVIGVDGGGGNDTLIIASGNAGSAASITTGMDGGPGSDTLTGGAGADRLDGGSGPDVLDGRGGADELGADDASGGGNDRLIGGPGDDVLTGDGPVNAFGPAAPAPVASGADVLDGGAGRDRVRYDRQPGPLQIDIAAQTAGGAAGAGDSLAGIEGAIGTPSADVLSGGADGDLLDGRAGADRLSGAGGDDVLIGGDGPDTVDGAAGDDIVAGGDGKDVLAGGPGDDRVDASERDGALPLGDDEASADRDVITCAVGLDIVVLPNASQPLRADCERVDLSSSAGVIDTRPVAAGRTGAVFRLRCPKLARADRCEAALALRSRTGLLLARSRPSFRGPAASATHRVRLAPTARGRTALRRSLEGARMEATPTFAGGSASLARRSWVLAP